MTPSGKKSRACSDSRRVAVVFSQDLYENGADAVVHLLRIPPATLNPMKDYAEKVLAPKGIPFFAVATRIAFEPSAAHPQFKFAPARLLNDEEAEAIMALRGSPDVERVLAETQEFPAGAAAPDASAASTGSSHGLSSGNGAAGQATPSASTSNPAPAVKQAAQKLRPASEEEAGADALEQPPPPAKAAAAKAAAAKAAAAKPAPAVEVDPLDAPPPAPRKKAAAKAAATPAETIEEEEVPPASTAKTTAGKAAQAVTSAPPADFDGLLDSILNG